MGNNNGEELKVLPRFLASATGLIMVLFIKIERLQNQ